MFTDSKHTIFDNVKAHKISKANIPEIEMDIKPFSINKDKLDTHLIDSVYKQPTFSFKLDNDLLDFYGYPDISLSSNPEYRYKYPKLSTEEFSRQMRQTEEGTPNQLNQFLRQDQNGESIEDIKAQDNAYQEGLKQIDKMINEDTAKFKKLYDEWDKKDDDVFDKIVEAEDNISKKETMRNNYKKSNPVIRPALPLKDKDLSKLSNVLNNDNKINEYNKKVAFEKLKNNSSTPKTKDKDLSKLSNVLNNDNKKNEYNKKVAFEKLKNNSSTPIKANPSTPIKSKSVTKLQPNDLPLPKSSPVIDLTPNKKEVKETVNDIISKVESDDNDDGKTDTDTIAQSESKMTKSQIIINVNSNLQKIIKLKLKDPNINNDTNIMELAGGNQIRSTAISLGLPSATKKLGKVEQFLNDLKNKQQGK